MKINGPSNYKYVQKDLLSIFEDEISKSQKNHTHCKHLMFEGNKNMQKSKLAIGWTYYHNALRSLLLKLYWCLEINVDHYMTTIHILNDQ